MRVFQAIIVVYLLAVLVGSMVLVGTRFQRAGRSRAR